MKNSAIKLKQESKTLKQEPKWLYYIKNAWIFLPVVFYFNVVSQTARNIPIMDDYEAILEFLTNFKGAEWTDKFFLLFSQHTDHRLLHSRILYVLYYNIFNNVNFRNLILIGDCQLIGIALVSVYFIKKTGVKYWNVLAFIWLLCIFDLNTYENGSMAMLAVQNYGIIWLFFASLFFYDRGGKWLIAAALFHFTCIFSSGNGIIASLFLVLFNLRSGNRWNKIISIAIMIAFAPLYFVGYRWGKDPDKLPFDIGTVIQFFIKMSGAPFNFDLSLIFGIILFIVLAAVFPYKSLLSDKRIWPFLCLLGFILGSMGTIALFRACVKNAQFQTSRYLIYPQLVIAITCLFIWIKLEEEKLAKFKFPVIGALLVISLVTYSRNYQFGKAGFARTSARSQYYKYWHPDPKKCARITKDACDLGIYCLEQERWDE